MFDILDEPDYTSVVPGGRVERGESIEDAAVRELLEETGLEVRVVRELGVLEQPSWRVPGVRDRNHFLQAVPAEPVSHQWDHLVGNGVLRCRWIPLLVDTEVYGHHGALLHAVVRGGAAPDDPFRGRRDPSPKTLPGR